MKNNVQKNFTRQMQAIFRLDLALIKSKLMDASEGPGWTQAQADRCEREYKRFLTLAARYPDAGIVPSVEIDTFWHTHILDTRKYAADCAHALGFFLHHTPHYGAREVADAEKMAGAFSHTQRLYEQVFGSADAGAEQAAWCTATEVKADQQAAWCTVTEGKPGQQAAWCTVTEGKPGQQAAWCTVTEGKPSQQAAWCTVTEVKPVQQAAWCTVTEGKPAQQAAWCTVTEVKPGQQAAWCTVTEIKAGQQAAWCTVTEDEVSVLANSRPGIGAAAMSFQH